ncbi:hypothetical protein IZR09_000527 [Salmonella enterica]|nr:hypothetical protein [Salmonella enterica]ECD9410839.1 hypothetical protein [Salmonella enterica subsp. salamae]EDU0564750.1 hypothetical protein [Salmonella enterica subsp. salamae]EGP4346798.1 hypothetical protein [Salmonella enterica]ELI0423877.1 hypothetical protein [Salmonella enterica]
MESIDKVDFSSVPSRIKTAATQLVYLKYRLDCLGRVCPDNLTSDLHGPMNSGEYGPHFGECFLSSIIPFIPSNRSKGNYQVRQVPINHVLGCSWRWWPDILEPEDEKSVIEHIFSDSGIQNTGYILIPELALITAGEGKNRVNFCREKGINWLPSQVAEKHYPAADKLKLIVKNIAGGHDVWAIYNDRYLQKVTHYAFAMPLLKAYGVKILTEWPSEMPSLDFVIKTSSELRYEKNMFTRPAIDLSKCEKYMNEIQAEEIFVHTNLAGINIKNRLPFVVTFLSITILAIILTDIYPSISFITQIIIAFCLGTLTTLYLPVFKIKKKFIG